MSPPNTSIPPPPMHGMPPPPLGTPADQRELDETPPLPADASQTLYIQNLNEKVKPETMKATLTNLFSNYGSVLSVVLHTNLRLRGQAFVSLDEVQAADKARREAHLFPLYGKAMKIGFAKSQSDAVVLQKTKEEGGEESEAFKQHKERRLEHKKMARRGNVLRRKELEKKIRAKRAAAGEIAEPAKAASSKRTQQEMPDEYLPPNKMLFLQNIPEGVGKGELESLFSAYVSCFPPPCVLAKLVLQRLTILCSMCPSRLVATQQIFGLCRRSNHPRQGRHCLCRVLGCSVQCHGPWRTQRLQLRCRRQTQSKLLIRRQLVS